MSYCVTVENELLLCTVLVYGICTVHEKLTEDQDEYLSIMLIK